MYLPLEIKKNVGRCPMHDVSVSCTGRFGSSPYSRLNVNGLSSCSQAFCSQPVYCAAVYRERRYLMLCENNFSSWRWAC